MTRKLGKELNYQEERHKGKDPEDTCGKRESHESPGGNGRGNGERRGDGADGERGVLGESGRREGEYEQNEDGCRQSL